MAASKKKQPAAAPPPEPHAWSQRPDPAAIEAHVNAFFAAIRANTPAVAFALCLHAEPVYPFLKVPDKKSIAAAFKLLRRVLTDNKVVELEDECWYERLGVSAVRIDGTNNVLASVTRDGAPTQLTGLFMLVERDGRWQLGFNMLRVLR